MPSVQANGLQLEYETFGDSAHPPLLMIMGLGMQMVAWPDGLCQKLAGQGFYVVRFDNRDIGLSTPFDHLGVPNIPWQFVKYEMHMPIHAHYLIDDMADDTAALLDALKLAPAHVVGASMGGMIGQSLSARYPEKARTLTSIMSTTGKRSLPKPSLAARAAMLTPPAKRGDIEGGTQRMMKLFRTIGGRIKDSDADLRALCVAPAVRPAWRGNCWPWPPLEIAAPPCKKLMCRPWSFTAATIPCCRRLTAKIPRGSSRVRGWW